MDRERFDALARLLATKGSRRGALSAILGVALFGQDPDEGLAKPGKGKRKGHSQGQRKGHAKGRGKGHEKGKGQGHTERVEPDELETQEAAAAPELEDDGPDVQAEGQGGRGKSKGKRRGKGKGKGRGKDKGRDEKSRNQRAQAEAIPTSCCGTLGCPTPTPGSNRQKCNYAGQNLSGVIAGGANMQQVDGRGTTFSTAANPSDWTGVNWYKACLQNSTWNGAILGGANFDQACLFDADLTGAKVDNSTNTESAKFCRTKLWTGVISNRDCNKGTNCCPACDETQLCPNGQICCNGRCRTGNCCVTGDCADRVCQTKVCTNNQCQYTPVTGGTCPAPGGGTGTCCAGVCCAPNQVCDTRPTPDVCCTPQTQQQTCEGKCGNVVNNCGQTVNCGPCAPRTCQTGTCNAQNTCDYVNQPNGQPGTNCNTICCNGNCCTPGQVCNTTGAAPVCCTPISICPAGACGDVPNGCGGTINCGPCAVRTCQNGTCNQQNTCDYVDSPDNQPGPNCPEPGFCCDGGCCTSSQVCFQDSCCTPQTFNQTCGVGTMSPKCGNVTNNCGQTIDCGPCAIRTCQTGTCNDATDTCEYANQPSGQPGNNCASPLVCCEGVCCTMGQVCDTSTNPDTCCTPDSQADTCAGRCGDVTNNCGQTVNCGTCPAQTCRTVVCNAMTDVCDYTIQPNGLPGTNCTNQCCNGNCCPAGNVCTNGQCVGTCGGQVCGQGQICCGNRCETGICCELQEGCNPGTCCAGLTCIPVSPPNPNLPPSICQQCCQSGPDCPADMNCVGEPAFCGTNICTGNKCCRPRSCNNPGQCISNICCNGVCCIGNDICVNNICVSP